MPDRGAADLGKLGIEYGNAICYSGYREGQSPVDGTYPSSEQVREDLRILDHNWQYLRLYDCSRHAELVLDAIEREGFDFRVMLGADMRAELSNPSCPWGAKYTARRLASNRAANATATGYATRSSRWSSSATST